MSTKRVKIVACVAALAAFTLLGCAGRGQKSGSVTDAAGEGVSDRTGEFASTTPSAMPTGEASVDEMEAERLRKVQEQLQDVFFDFDKSDIRSDARAALVHDARVLRDNADVKVFLEGHCDERGTNEYNLALGERRARSTKDYLVQAGVAADRLLIISYGEERPFATGHDEESWQLNRRTHLKVRTR